MARLATVGSRPLAHLHRQLTQPRSSRRRLLLALESIELGQIMDVLPAQPTRFGRVVQLAQYRPAALQVPRVDDLVAEAGKTWAPGRLSQELG
jgi:hypothetical protein